jgi:NADPH:quinone reductase
MAALRAVRADGLVLWFGQASGIPPVLDFFDWDVPLGVTLHRFGYQPPGPSDAADLATLVRLVERGDLHPEIGLRQDWAFTPAAFQALIHRQIRGNAVLTINRGLTCAPGPASVSICRSVRPSLGLSSPCHGAEEQSDDATG